MEISRFTAIQQYVDFNQEASSALNAFLPISRPYFPALVDDFYEAISRDPAARSVITGGQEQVERLKATLLSWLESLHAGPHDQAYVETRSRIGQVHVRINLGQEYMLTAVNRVRVGLTRIAFEKLSPDRAEVTASAVNKALDLELALMLATYREDWMARVDASARLAAIGQIAASIGHELRNPLGVVESSLYLINQRLQKTGVRDEVLEKHLGRIQAQTKQCSATITSLLEMAREAPLRRVHFSVIELMNECVGQLCHADDLQVSVHVSPELRLYADREQLAQVLMNLLRNAVEAIAGPGHIEVGAEQRKGGTELWVQDDGPGVEPTNRTQIFDVLFTTRAKGTGLGLALCRKIVDRHGGELQLDSNPRQGARFRIWLPGKAR